MNIVEAHGLRKYYGKENNLVKAVDGVDFGIRRGEFVAIVGMSGSGKSTLLYMLGGEYYAGYITMTPMIAIWMVYFIVSIVPVCGKQIISRDSVIARIRQE